MKNRFNIEILDIVVVGVSACAWIIVIIIVSSISAVTSHDLHDLKENKVSKQCQEILMDTQSHYGACFADYWEKYRSCSNGVIGTMTGCLLLAGTKGPPECYPENCAVLHRMIPDKYSLWKGKIPVPSPVVQTSISGAYICVPSSPEDCLPKTSTEPFTLSGSIVFSARRTVYQICQDGKNCWKAYTYVQDKNCVNIAEGWPVIWFDDGGHVLPHTIMFCGNYSIMKLR